METVNNNVGSICTCVKRNGLQCGKSAVNGLCRYHAKIEAERVANVERNKRHKLYYNIHLELGLREVRDDRNFDLKLKDATLQELENQNFITTDQRTRLLRIFALELIRTFRIPRTENERISMDRQNVHRKVVTDNTNGQTDKLLTITIPLEQNTLEEIQTLFGDSRTVMRDVEYWYAKTTCRNEGDCIYKRTLDGLWAHIKASPNREELTKRLKEELIDSVEKCCEGHMSRLCNVLVGFNDSLTTIVSKSDILQQRLAEIAALEITERTKKIRARKVLRELEIPVSEHKDWLDAF